MERESESSSSSSSVTSSLSYRSDVVDDPADPPGPSSTSRRPPPDKRLPTLVVCETGRRDNRPVFSGLFLRRPYLCAGTCVHPFACATSVFSPSPLHVPRPSDPRPPPRDAGVRSRGPEDSERHTWYFMSTTPFGHQGPESIKLPQNKKKKQNYLLPSI